MNELLSSLVLSLRIALCSTIVVTMIGVPLAYIVARKSFFGRSALETLLMTPLVLPPTVVGYLIILIVGVHGPVGWLFNRAFGFRFIFSEAGAVIASVIVSLPLLLLPAKTAFASVEREFEQIAQLMGAGPFDLFWHVNLPLARRGVVCGVMLAFARSLGEFGATMMIFGIQEDRLTLPISVYQDFTNDQFKHALPAVILLTAASLLVMIVYNRWPRSGEIISAGR